MQILICIKGNNIFSRMENNNSSLSIQENLTFDEQLYREQFNTEYFRRVLPVSVIFGLTAVLGFVSNMIVVYIYGLKYKRCNFKYFLFVMGVIGVVQCSIMLPTQAAEMHYWFVFPESWLCRVSAYVFGYTVIACYFVLLLIAIDRFRKVCRPYGWQIQANTARNLCILVSIAALVFALPPGIISGHHNFVTSYKGRNITVTVCATDDMYQNRDWAIYFLLISGGFPVSVVIVVTCALYGLILTQFYQGTAVQLQSLYKNASTQVANDLVVTEIPRSCSVTEVIPNNTPEGSPTRKCKSPDSDSKVEKKSPPKSFDKVIRIFFRNQDGFNKSDGKQSGVLRSSGSSISRGGVRHRIMRKTLIVLIITVTCIVALILTFCLHIIAEDINRNALGVSEAKLLAFVIFHRGSFSIICAVFPIVYGIRDPKFRHAILQMFSKNAQMSQTPAQNVPSMNEDSRC